MINKRTIIKENGITLIALVVTIIVLLILAGITIMMVLNNNGIINKSIDAKNTSIIEKEKEAISFAWSALLTDKTTKEVEITSIDFENELNNSGNDTTVSLDEDETAFIVYFIESTNTYSVDFDGNITLNKTITYAIRFELNGGANPSEQVKTYKAGETVTLLNATKDNSYFVGWFETSDFSTEKVVTISNRNEDIVLYAKWEDETPSDLFEWNVVEQKAILRCFSEKGQALYDSGNLTELAIPSKYNNMDVTEIANNAFKDKTNLKSLLIHEGIIKLGEKCFSGCNGINKLNIPISLSVSWPSASSNWPFAGCTGLTDVYFSKGNRRRSRLFKRKLFR